ncbi:uncharacterized protein LOC130054653 isoform X1 [Ostrea edulis]|uniref:uncharacterized protein LOC130054653 isoform X1 n=1 Tax=Ostrea edulis TaxID=37623 RepID=UPI0024AF31D9|nr:uncharacterized protein LOC130054653 isoform X1 [Ostrea edulis]
MAQREGFYFTLPSDGSKESFPSNTAAQFKILLPQSLDLTDGDWEVGLTEMMFPNALKNITVEEAYFDILVPEEYLKHVKNPDIFKWGRFRLEKVKLLPLRQCPVLVEWPNTPWTQIIDSKMAIVRIHFRPGAYVHSAALIDEINEGLAGSMKKIWKTMGNPKDESFMKLVNFEKYERIMYQFKGKALKKIPLCVRFPTSLAYMLGMDSQKLILPNELETKWINVTYLGNNTTNVYENLKFMYVYCDVVNPQVVGSNKLKLLRVVPCTFHLVDGQQAKWEPIRAEYLKLSKKHFDTIDIHIMTSLGTPMPFLNGRTLVKLHFRKVY